MGLTDKLKDGIRTWLQIDTSGDGVINIANYTTFEGNAITNRIWYIGDPEELTQLYEQLDGAENSSRFWRAKNSTGRRMRKVHVGIPALIVDTLSNIVANDLTEVSLSNEALQPVWEEVERENDFLELLKTAVTDALYLGDGAFKVSLDPSLSKYPIIEWYPADRVDLKYKRGRLMEIVYKTPITREGKRAADRVLLEHYGKGYVHYRLTDLKGDKEYDLESLSFTNGLTDVTYDYDFIMGVPFMVYKSPKYKGRGKSVYDAKRDCFDSLDEAWSQWMQAVRDGRSTKYIPDNLIPRDPNTGKLVKPNPFDNQFIGVSADMKEGAKNEITVVQPDIPTDRYLETYITALDLCLQGLISPSTLGIDTKKLDNADAQREKEKTTLYTRDSIIDAMQKTVPKIIDIVMRVYCLSMQMPPADPEAFITFSDYANPSFESQIETLGKAKTQGVMSNEAIVDDLYGDTKDEEWKAEEVARLYKADGLTEVTTPSLMDDW